MPRQPFWICFLSFLILGIGGYTLYTSWQVWQWRRLDQQIPAQEIQWSVISLSDESFVPFARYQFNQQGKSYQGQTRWKETYLNEWTAQEAIQRLSHAPPLVWFDSSSPEISSLQNLFPLKETLYTLLLWSLGLYFLGLGYYVKRRFL